jgi:hypothetical protein
MNSENQDYYILGDDIFIKRDKLSDVRNITIPFDEYKELLEIKGRYEELKSIKQVPYEDINSFKPPYKITCCTDLDTFNCCHNSINTENVYKEYK